MLPNLHKTLQLWGLRNFLVGGHQGAGRLVCPDRLQKGESPRLGVRPALWMELLTSKAVKLRKKGGVTALEIGFELVSAGCTHPETHM